MEKRRERRFKQWNRASIKSADGPREFSDSAGINAYTYDISLSGAKIYSDVDFPAGTSLRMHVELVRSKDIITIDGVVRWSAKNEDYKVFELGLQFFNLLPSTVLTLIQNLYDQSPGIPTRLTSFSGPGGRRPS